MPFAALLLGAPGCREASGAGAIQLLSTTLEAERFTEGRPSGDAAWAPCALDDTSARVAQPRCGESRPGSAAYERLAEVARAAAPWLRADSGSAALRATALLDLRWRDAAPRGVDRAVRALERAVRTSPRSAALLNDLAVAYLTAAEQEQKLAPLLRALDAAERALEADSVHAPARFNRALAMQRLSLTGGARRAWASYLAIDQRGRWADEGRVHLARLDAELASASRGDLPAADDLLRPGGVSRDQLRVASVRSPQGARELDIALLGAWGDALVRGDTARARRAIDAARAVAEPLRDRPVDRSVARALAEVNAAERDAQRLARLARGHAALADGFALQARAAYDDAVPRLALAERELRAAGSPALHWATLYRGLAEVFRGRYAAAEAAMRQVQVGARSDEPALVGKAHWGLGVGALRRGAYDEAFREYGLALPYFVLASEPENQGAVAYLRAEARELAGRGASAGDEALAGLRVLSRFRRSAYLNLHLSTVAARARAYGQERAALVLLDEALVVAQGIPRPHLPALAHLARAEQLHALGRDGNARRAVAEALGWADRVQPGHGRDRLRADAGLLLAEVVRADSARVALRMLSAVVDTYRALGTDTFLARALYQRSLAAAADGDARAARRDLDAAILVIERQRASHTTPASRAALYQTAEGVFDAMTRLELDAGRPGAAFAYTERGRVAVRDPTRRPGDGAPPLLRAIATSLRHDELFAEYAVLDDRVVVWTATRRGVAQHTVALPRDSVAALVDRMVGELEDSAFDPRQAGAQLHDLLLGPALADLPGVRRLTVVPDRELTRVPFAALREPATGRYVLQDLEVRTLPSAGFLAGAAAGQRGRGSGALAPAALLAVGDPSSDAARGDGGGRLPRLPAAAREAARVAALYTGARLLTGAGATRRAVLTGLPLAEIFHFAGHAVGNVDDPEISFLALAGDAMGGELRAREIGALQLSRLRLVVLSACSTLDPRPSRMGAVAGLAFSFLRAGAPATVSTLWDVADAPTSDVLVEFHRHYAAGASAAAALRLAQLSALTSPHAVPRTPRAWAAFVYTGP